MAIVESRKIGQDRLKELEQMMFGKDGSRAIKEGYESDAGAIREILLYIENDGDIYKRSITPLITNYAKKMAKDSFDKELGIKGFMPVVEMGLKAYAKDFGGKWSELLAVKDRKKVAEDLLDGFMDEIKDQAKEIKDKQADKKPSKKKESTQFSSKNVKVSTTIDNSQYYQRPTVRDFTTVDGVGSSYNEAFENAFEELFNTPDISEEFALDLETYVKETYATLYNDETDQITPILQKEAGDSFDPEGNNETDLNVYVILSFEMPRALDNPSEEMPESVRKQLGEMARHSGMGLDSYDGLMGFLNGKPKKNLPGTQTVAVEKDGAVAVEYRGTAVVTHYEDGSVDLDTGGWFSVTTKDRMNSYLSDMSISQRKGQWYLTTPKGEFPFEGRKASISPDGSVEFSEKTQRKGKWISTMKEGKMSSMSIKDYFDENQVAEALVLYDSQYDEYYITPLVGSMTEEKFRKYLNEIKIGLVDFEIEYVLEDELDDILSQDASYNFIEPDFEESVSSRSKKFLALAIKEGEAKKKTEKQMASEIAKIMGIKESKTGFFVTKSGVKTAKGLILEAKSLIVTG